MIPLTGPHSSGLPFVGPSNRIGNIERRRTISLKMLSHQNSTASDSARQRSQTPEPSKPPFERLEYPLPDRKYEEMLKQMPVNHERLEEVSSKVSESEETVTAAESGSSSAYTAISSTAKKARRGSKSWREVEDVDDESEVPARRDGRSVSGVVSRLIEDSDLESMESPLPEEDPNDPEWVVPQEEDER